MHQYLRAGLWACSAVILLLGAIAYAGLCAYLYLSPGLPDVAALRDVRLQVPPSIYSRDGRLIAQIGEYRRKPVSYEQIPQRLIDAVLATEDDRFFEHSGVDYQSLVRAMATAWRCPPDIFLTRSRGRVSDFSSWNSASARSSIARLSRMRNGQMPFLSSRPRNTFWAAVRLSARARSW